jgi:hypothetical protein
MLALRRISDVRSGLVANGTRSAPATQSAVLLAARRFDEFVGPAGSLPAFFTFTS